MNEAYEKYKQLKQSNADIDNAIGLMSWDQEVNMPSEGADFRARQIATLSGLSHEMGTSSELSRLLDELMKDKNLSIIEQRNVQESHRVLSKQKKLSKAFVEKESKAVSEAYQTWIKARQENSFALFAPKLKEVVELQREKAQLYGYADHPYDALMDDYERGLTTKEVEKIFADVKANLGNFFAKIKDQPEPNQSFLKNNFDKQKQLELCRKIVTDLGYSWDTGRLDLSEHPFSISFNPKDARITTRVNTRDIQECIWGGIHETGHAFYEMGLPESEYGLPSGAAASLGIHESQSRLWENNVGKSFAFIKAYWPLFQEYFPEAFMQVDADDFFRALNTIKPDLIRINSDEVTYHFHILLRFEIEKGLIEGSLQVNDLEEIWNHKIKEYLYLDVPSPKEGVLQDIHWSHGSFGYFPTYSLGSFYAAQFFHFAGQAIPGLQEQIEHKEFGSLLQWLRQNIHRYGRTYSSKELCEKATGEPLNYRYFDEYLHKKYALVYAL